MRLPRNLGLLGLVRGMVRGQTRVTGEPEDPVTRFFVRETEDEVERVTEDGDTRIVDEAFGEAAGE